MPGASLKKHFNNILPNLVRLELERFDFIFVKRMKHRSLNFRQLFVRRHHDLPRDAELARQRPRRGKAIPGTKPSELDGGADTGADLRRQRPAAIQRQRWNRDDSRAFHFKMVLVATVKPVAE